MNSADVRVLLAVTYTFEGSDYAAIRRRLTQKAWDTVSSAMQVGLYLDAYTFPRWTSTDGMMAFAPLHGVINITGDACICYQVNRSPIDDLISTDRPAFAQEELHSPRLLAFLPGILDDGDLSDLFIWLGECEELTLPLRANRDQACATIRSQLTAGLHEDLALIVT